MKRYVTFRSLAAALTAFVLAASPIGAAQAAPVARTCTPAPSAVGFKASTLSSFTSSTTYVNIPEASLNFQQGAAGCVIVLLSGPSDINGNISLMYVRAVINGVVGLPEDERWSGGDSVNGIIYRTHSKSFVFPRIPAGNHVLHMQYRVDDGANTGAFMGHNLVLYYVP